MMKHLYKFVLLAFVAGVTLMPTQRAGAQATGDTLVVDWRDDNGDVLVNALRNAILADTARPEGRVYKLLQGGFYHNSERIENSGFHLRIVGEPGGPTEFDNPPVLQMVSRDDGTVDGRLITVMDDITLKNLWITGADENGTQTYYEPITNNASNSRVLIENVIFDRSNFAMTSYYGTNNDITYRDCTFRNLIGEPSTQQWEGRGISVWADQDSVIVENCTFFNVGMTALQVEGGSANYVLFAHNTLVNVGRSINAGNWWQEAYFANNLLINTFWHGEGFADINSPGRDPRATTAGMFSIGELPSVYGPEEGRRILFANAASWRDPDFAAYYADSIRAQPYANPITREDFFDTYENMVITDTTRLATQPSLSTYPDELVPDMIQNINDLRSGITPANPYFWMLPEFEGEVCHVCVSWPLPEDFSYTDTDLMTAGTDGLPLGDLNWFPQAKDDWLTNRDQYVAEIKDMAGPVRVLTVEGSSEAENLTVGGDAEVQTVEGFTYFDMESGGFIEWTFDLANAGVSELVVYTHLRGNSDRGQRIIVNGTNIRNSENYGEYFWSTSLGDPSNEWFTTTITQADLIEGADALDLPAGTNTIRIEPSWGFQYFSGIDVVQGGNTVAELRAPEAEYSVVTPVAEGVAYTPSGFKSVNLNTDGSITWDIDAPQDGTYRLQLFYQAPNGSQTAQVDVDGQTALSGVTLEGTAGDSSGLSLLTDSFMLTQGAHQITLSGSQVSIDVVQLILEQIVSSVADTDNQPDEFSLSQNYPNPFNPETTIRYRLNRGGDLKLEIFNVLGQKVKTLVNEVKTPGAYTVVWDGTNDLGAPVATGMYIYRLKVADDFVQSRKMLFLK